MRPWLASIALAWVMFAAPAEGQNVQAADPEPSEETLKAQTFCNSAAQADRDFGREYRIRHLRIARRIGNDVTAANGELLFSQFRSWVGERCQAIQLPFELRAEEPPGHAFMSVDLRWSDFTGTHFKEALLGPTVLVKDPGGEQVTVGAANLDNASLLGARVTNSDARGVQFAKALFAFAEIDGSKFAGANLRGAVLVGTSLRDSDFSSVSFAGANLSNAKIIQSKIDNADFENANLSGVIWEVEPGSLPKMSQIARATGLSEMRFQRGPTSLIELRNALDRAGFAIQAAEVNFSIRRTFREHKLSGGPLEFLLGVASYVLFEITCDYGADPYRPLLLILALIPLFAICFYLIVRYDKGGAIWINRPRNMRNGRSDTRWLRLGTFLPRSPRAAMLTLVSTTFWFSFINSFRIGFREFNIGDWLTRVHAKEFAVRYSGLAKSIAGIQSLVGSFLLALTVISAVGKPFW